MSAKKRRKIHGVRREFRRPRGWTKWFNEGLMEAEPTGGIEASTATGGQDASKLFDDSSSTQMTFADGKPTVTWAYRGAKQGPTFYTVTSGANPGDPADWQLLGSQNGKTWTAVDTRIGEVFTSRNQTKPYKMDKPGRFSQFRLVVSKTIGAPQANLAEIELLAGGADALVVETCQDLLQVKAAVLGMKQAMTDEGRTEKKRKYEK